MTEDEFYMQKAIDLALLGKGKVSPNPMVGCVIVKDNQIIAQGFHEKYGGYHAERNAVLSLENPEIVRDSTVYVTLEPCSHYGKTPPCAKLLVQYMPQKVVIGSIDSNPIVHLNGVKILQDAGIEVVIGVLEKECRELNERFFTFMEHKRPYVILKWAQTQDGFIARSNYDSKWISCEASRRLTHQWRAEEDAIMVGTNTALYDNPQLNVRMVEGKNPVRIVIDKELKLPKSLHLFDQKELTLVYNYQEDRCEDNLEFIRISKDKPLFLQILSDLYQRKIMSLFVEGGSVLIQSIIDNNLWDEARIFESETLFENGILAPKINTSNTFPINIDSDKLFIIKNI